MWIYSFFLLHCYYFFKKQGRFRPLEISSLFLTFFIATPLFCMMILIQKSAGFRPIVGVAIAVTALLGFLALQRKCLMGKAFRYGKARHVGLAKKSVRYLGFVLFGTMIGLALLSLALVISGIKR